MALEFLKHFCSGDVIGISTLLGDDLQFNGPFHQFSSREAYLDSLKVDPPEKCGCRVLSVTENGDSVSVYYDYEKCDKTITIAQLFKFRNQKISEILLVFDGREFA